MRQPLHEYNDGPPGGLYGPIGCGTVADGRGHSSVSDVAETLQTGDVW